MPKSRTYTKPYKHCDPCKKEKKSPKPCKPCEKKVKKPVDFPKRECRPKCTCEKVDLDVKVKTLSICLDTPRSPSVDNVTQSGARLVFIYEIGLLNKTCHKIRNLSIIDNFGGFFDSEGLTAIVQAQTCSDTLTISENLNDLENGFLLNPCKSYIRPCSYCSLRVLLALSPEATRECLIIPQVFKSTIVVDGCIEDCESKTKCPGEPCRKQEGPAPWIGDSGAIVESQKNGRDNRKDRCCDPCDCKHDCDCDKKPKKKKECCKSKILPIVVDHQLIDTTLPDIGTVQLTNVLVGSAVSTQIATQTSVQDPVQVAVQTAVQGQSQAQSQAQQQ